MTDPAQDNRPPPHAPGRRFRHRVPKTFRQHWKVVAALVVFVVVMTTVFGQTRIRPYITGDAAVIASEVTENVQGTVDLFDSSVAHDVSVEISDQDYREMVTSFEVDGEKEWISANVTIDGTLLTDVGVRLKGNSTLLSLRGDMPMPGAGGDMPMPGAGGDMPMPGAGGDDTAPPAKPGSAGGVEAGPESGSEQAPAAGMIPGLGGSLSFDSPEELPFLISFDEFYEGRAYQGHTTLSLRPYTPALNEAVSLAITEESGQSTQDFAYTTYSVNDSPTATRLLVVAPDDGYANSLDEGNGVLYKATSTSDFSYQGDDQTTYVEQFKQINGRGSADLQPVISLLKWLDSADQDEFDEHLADHVDVESLARYLALQNLLVNGDDMAGPGKNFYLYYDLDTKKFTVISWDLNLALNSDWDGGPHDSQSMMDMAGGPAGQLPEGMSIPEGMMPPGGPGDGAGPAGGFTMGNSLKERFMESSAFTDVYDSAYREIYRALWESGRVQDIVDEVAASIPVSDNLTQAEIDTAAEELRGRLQSRTDALADDEIIRVGS